MNLEERLRALAEAFPLAVLSAQPTSGPARGVITHDYTRRYWGHDFSYTASEDGRKLTLMIWGPPFHVGDYLIIPNKDRATRYRITAVKWLCDPSDMYRLEAEFAPRTEADE